MRVLLLALFLTSCVPAALSQAVGTKLPFQQILISADRITSSPAQVAYDTASSALSFISADHALVQFNATTFSALTVNWNIVLSGASTTISYTGGAASITSSTGVFKFFDATNTGGLTITLDGSNNPTLSSSGTQITVSSTLIAAHSIQISNSTGRIQFSAGDAKLTSVTKNFTFWDDAKTANLAMWFDSNKAGYMATTGGNMTFSGGDFTTQTSSPTSSSFHVTDGTTLSNMQMQCYPDVGAYCGLSFNMRYTQISTNPSFLLPNSAKIGHRVRLDQTSTRNLFVHDFFTGSTNANLFQALSMDTSSLIWQMPYYLTGPYAWRQVFTSGSGTVTIPSYVKVVYVTVIGAGGAGAQNAGRTAGYAGGGGGCILNFPVIINTAFATTMSYSVGARALVQSGSSTVNYGGYIISGAGGFGATSGGTPGNGGGYTIGSTTVSVGGTGGYPGTAGTPSQPYFFPGGGGGGSNAAGGASGYIPGVGADAAGFGAGGSSCLGQGATGTTVATGAGGGGESGKVSGGSGYIELFGLGGI